MTKAAERVLAVVPARGGSKGLPGKNVRPLMGVPLIGHTILMARSCACIDRVIVSTDSEEIAAVARRYDADVPFRRPAELAQDDTPIWPVLRHALDAVENLDEGRQYDFLILLDPTSPGRLSDDVAGALERLRAVADADGIIGVSRPSFNPVWTCVVEQDGWMADLFQDGARYTRRQDVPPVFHINAVLYIWRTEFVRREPASWRHARNLIYETPEMRAIHIDESDDFARAEAGLRAGLIRFPWMRESAS